MKFRIRQALVVAALLFGCMVDAVAQAPAVTIPADVAPLFVVTYVETMPTAREQAATLLKSYRDASRTSAGNLRSIVVQRPRRPGQFVIVATWKDKAAWEAHSSTSATKEFRDRIHALRNVPADDRFHNGLAVGPID